MEEIPRFLILFAALILLGGCAQSLNVPVSPSRYSAPTASPTTEGGTNQTQATATPSPILTPSPLYATSTPSFTNSPTSTQVSVATSTPTFSFTASFTASPTPSLTVATTPTLTSIVTSTPTVSSVVSDDIIYPGYDGLGDMLLYKVHPDGTGLTALTNGSMRVFHPSWSPDKSRIVFNDYATTSQLVIIQSDGTGAVTLPNAGGPPAWSPDGAKIAFLKNDSNGKPQIWTIHPDGTSPSQVTFETYGVTPEDFAWSPDGQKIVYDAYHYVAPNLGYSISTRITQVDGSLAQDFPVTMAATDWSPDGKSFIFGKQVGVVNSANIWQIFKVNIDGTGLTQLTSLPGSYSCASWSKDGSKIVVVNLSDAGSANMFLINPDGSGMTQIPNASIYYCYQPCWH